MWVSHVVKTWQPICNKFYLIEEKLVKNCAGSGNVNTHAVSVSTGKWERQSVIQHR